MTTSHRNLIVSIFPERVHCDAVGNLVKPFGGIWTHLAISGDDAHRLLDTGKSLLTSIERDPSAIDRDMFSRAVLNSVPAPGDNDRFLIISPTTCPLDLVRDDTGNWGDRAIFSHLDAADAPSAHTFEKALRPRCVSLGTYLLLCPMAMDRSLARHLQDIVIVATKLESALPVEISLQPPYERARASFTREDVSWLHVDTHGTSTSIMLGPSRDSRQIADSTDLPEHIPVPLVILVGCQLTSGAASIGSAVLERGPTSIWGPCVTFSSLSLAGSDDSQILWYDRFFRSLLHGHDVGESLLLARQSLTTGSALKFTWLILGSSLLSFGVKPDGVCQETH
ncbi:MAG: hypothetical protein NT169_19995 [Chloroflexi bacterium]|nr:hypothetical protein [Chloroflexota bacterium]